MSFGFAWLTRRSQSVWPAAIAHGANNTLSSGMLVLANAWVLDQVTSVAAAALVATFFGWRLVKLSRRAVRSEPDSPNLDTHARAAM